MVSKFQSIVVGPLKTTQTQTENSQSNFTCGLDNPMLYMHSHMVPP